MDSLQFQEQTGLDPKLLMSSHLFRQFNGQRHYIIPKGKKSGTPLSSHFKRMNIVSYTHEVNNDMDQFIMTDANGTTFTFYAGFDEDGVNGFWFVKFIKSSYDKHIAKGTAEETALGFSTLIYFYRNASIDVDTIIGHEVDFSITFGPDGKMFTLVNMTRINGKLFGEFPEYDARFYVSPAKPPMLNGYLVEDTAEISQQPIVDVHFGEDSIGSGLDFDLAMLDLSNSEGVYYVSLVSRNGHDKEMASARVNVNTQEVLLLDSPHPDHVNGTKRKLRLSDF